MTTNTNTLLEKKNPHLRDANITFEPVAHKYTIHDGRVYATTYDEGCKPPYISVTTWIHSHFENFDADAIISRMMASPKWPLSAYYGKTREEIKAGWDKSRDEAADAGTKLHYAIECYYNGGAAPGPPYNGGAAPGPSYNGGSAPGPSYNGGSAPGPPQADTVTHIGGPGGVTPNGGPGGVTPIGGSGGHAPEYNYFINFTKKHAADFVPYRTEWMVYDEEVRIAGSIDMLFEDPLEEGVLMIYDWKRSKEIKKTSGFDMKYATTECINHLPDSNFWHYSLQLNIYKAIIERNYGKKVTRLMLVCLHPNNKNGDYILVKVPDLQAEVRELFEERKKQLTH